MIDQRAHGESEGRLIGFGIREYEDVALWMHYATVNLSGTIWLHGVSMGAVSCLLAVSRGFPDRLRGIIADSAYDGIDELLFYQSMRKYRLPRRLIIPLLAVSGRLLLGEGFNKLSPSKAAAECALPLLMIHGDNDHTIPPDMPARYRAVCGDRTTFVTIPGARHAMCWLWCPFRLIMRNKCCTTCRIFNWDHLMMFSPFVLTPGFYTTSLLIVAFAAWVVWEVCVMVYPERFWERTNVALQCANCTDKLCTQYCRKLRQ